MSAFKVEYTNPKTRKREAVVVEAIDAPDALRKSYEGQETVTLVERRVFRYDPTMLVSPYADSVSTSSSHIAGFWVEVSLL